MNWQALSPANWRAGLAASFERFPLAILCGVIGAGCAIVGIHYDKNDALVGQCVRLAMTATLGLPLFFSLQIIRECTGTWRRWPPELLGFVILAAWFFTHSSKPFDEPAIMFVRWGLVLAALHFLAAISPYLFRAEDAGFWQFNRRLFLRFTLATLYSGVLTLGLELALLSADRLFDLKLDHAYGDLWFLMVGCFHPIFFLAGVPRDFTAQAAETEYPRGLKAFTQFALAPLVLVYGGILYAYAFKIVALRSWPHGWVALPVLLLAGVGIFASLLLHPLPRQPNERWAVWFGRVFPLALAPLALLLFLSVQVRISHYGFTEERYLGVVASAWIMLWALVFALRRNAGIRWIPASLALIALAIAYGPWSAGAVSKRSQLARLGHILHAHGLVNENGVQSAARSIALENDEGMSLRSIIQYLVQMHGGTSIRPLFGHLLPRDNWSTLRGWNGSNAILKALNLTVKNDERWITYTRPADSPVDIAGFRNLWQIQDYYHSPLEDWHPRKCGDLRIGFDNEALKIASGDSETPAIVPLDSLLAKLPAASTPDLSADLMAIDFQHDGRSFRIVFQTLQLRAARENSSVASASFLLMER